MVVVITILLLFPPLFSISQGWEQIYGGPEYDFGRSICPTKDGGYIFVGDCWSCNQSIFVAKTDSMGDTLWSKSFGEPNWKVWDHTNSVIQTTDSGFAITGIAWSFGASTNLGDIFLLKLDKEGNQNWIKLYKNPSSTNEGQLVRQTIEGGYILANSGSYSTFNALDCYLIKTDDRGDTIWTYSYYGRGKLSGKSVEQTPDTGYIMSGYIDTPTDTLGEFGDTTGLFVLKSDEDGNRLWFRIFSSFISGIARPASSIYPTQDGGYIIAGDIFDSTVSYKSYLVKINALGDSVWSKIFDLQGSSNYPKSVVETAGRNIVVTGSSYDTAGIIRLYLMKTDPTGNILWVRYFQDYSSGWELQKTTDGGFVITGAQHSGNWDFYLIKTDSMGYILTPTDIKFIRNLVEHVKLFPNPFSQSSTLEFENNGNDIHDLFIYNLKGQLVQQYNSINGNRVVIERNKLISGIYFFRLKNSHQTLATGSLIIK